MPIVTSAEKVKLSKAVLLMHCTLAKMKMLKPIRTGSLDEAISRS